MLDATKVISQFGGVRALARAAGLPFNTVQYWKRVGYVPIKQEDRIRRLIRDQEIDPARFERSEAA